MSKFTMNPLSKLIVRTGSIFYGKKRSIVDFFSFDSYRNSPSFNSLIKPNTFELPRISALFLSIAGIFRSGASSQIFPSIIQSIMIAMVNLFSIFRFHYFSGHLDRTVAFLSQSIKTGSSRSPLCNLIPLVQPLKIFNIHDGILALRKRNKTVGLVERLDNFVSRNTAFRHRSSLKDRLLPAAYFITSLLFFAIPSQAASHYIRAGATGSNNGSDWTNAWTSLASVTWTRGDIYYIAAGSYAGFTFGQADSGTSVIELRGAVGGAGDHGTSTGWSDAFQGQASLTGSSIHTDYWKFNGQPVPGCTYPTNSPSCLLIKVSTTSTCDGCSAFRMDNTNTNVTMDYIEVQGSTANVDGVHDEGIYCAPGPCTPFYLGHSYVHDTGCDTLSFNWGTGGTGTFEYDWIARNNVGPTTAAHCQGIQSTIGTMIIRYSVWQDMQSSGAITLAAGGAGAPIVDWEIYGNIFFWDAAWTARWSGDGRVGYDDGIVGIFDETQGCCSTAPLKIYNNTIYGLGLSNSQNCNGQLYTINSNEFVLFTGYNNLYSHFTNSCNAGSAGAGTYDYNSYYDIANNTHDSGAHSTTSGSGAPLSNPTASTVAGFTLTADTSAGLSLSSPYNTDLYGTTRAANGTWDRGFFQITGVAPPPPAPPTAFRVTVIN